MAEANFKPIKKISVEKMEVKPNLDLEESYKDFDWESLYEMEARSEGLGGRRSPSFSLGGSGGAR